MFLIKNYFILHLCDESRQINLQLKSPSEIFTFTVNGKKNLSNVKNTKLVELTFCINSSTKIKYSSDDKKNSLLIENIVEETTIKIELGEECKRLNYFNIKKMEISFNQDNKTLIQYRESLLRGYITLRQEDDRSIIRHNYLTKLSDPCIWNLSNCIEISFEVYRDTNFILICKDGNGKTSLKNISEISEYRRMLQNKFYH